MSEEARAGRGGPEVEVELDRPRATCIVTNHNYGRFVEEAIESALAQTRPFDEIVVVDDGSTDDSRERLETRYKEHPVVRLLTQENGGQAAAFNAGYLASSGEILAFLDADDAYEPEFLARVLEVFGREPDVDFVFSAFRRFGRESGEVRKWERDQRFGISVLETLERRTWVGGPTSTLALRRRLAARLLPIPHPEDWRLEADDCLVFGAGLAGARKYFLAAPLVRYRVHDANRWYRGRHDAFARYRHALALNRLLETLSRRLGYDVARLAELAPYEFRTIERPSLRQLRRYLATLLRSRARLSRRWKGSRSLLRHFLASRRAAAAPRAGRGRERGDALREPGRQRRRGRGVAVPVPVHGAQVVGGGLALGGGERVGEVEHRHAPRLEEGAQAPARVVEVELLRPRPVTRQGVAEEARGDLDLVRGERRDQGELPLPAQRHQPPEGVEGIPPGALHTVSLGRAEQALEVLPLAGVVVVRVHAGLLDPGAVGAQLDEAGELAGLPVGGAVPPHRVDDPRRAQQVRALPGEEAARVGGLHVVADVEAEQDQVGVEGEALALQQLEIVRHLGVHHAEVQDLDRGAQGLVDPGQVVLRVGHDADAEGVAEGDHSHHPGPPPARELLVEEALRVGPAPEPLARRVEPVGEGVGVREQPEDGVPEGEVEAHCPLAEQDGEHGVPEHGLEEAQTPRLAPARGDPRQAQGERSAEQHAPRPQRGAVAAVRQADRDPGQH
jgi:glycosyltransferase involved in cell wall biosynthesis